MSTLLLYELFFDVIGGFFMQITVQSNYSKNALNTDKELPLIKNKTVLNIIDQALDRNNQTSKVKQSGDMSR